LYIFTELRKNSVYTKTYTTTTISTSHAEYRANNAFSIQCTLHANFMWTDKASALTAPGVNKSVQMKSCFIKKKKKNQAKVNSVMD
jgi:hypothetical protein